MGDEWATLRTGCLTPEKAGCAVDPVCTGESKGETLAPTRVRPAHSGSLFRLRCLGPHQFQTGVGISFPLYLQDSTHRPCPEPAELDRRLDLVSGNPLKLELNPICYLLALLGAHHFLRVSRIRVKLLTFRLLSYIYGAPILGVSRSHTTTQHSR